MQLSNPHASNPDDSSRKPSEMGGETSPRTLERVRCVACTHVRLVDACRYCNGRIPRVGPTLPPLDLLRGFRYYWRGVFAVINDKDFLGRILPSILLSALVFAGLLYAAITWVHPGVVAGYAALQSRYPIALWEDATPAITTIVAMFLLAPVIVTVFLFPVLDPLARIAERVRLGHRAEEHPRGPVADFWDSMDTAARILGMQVVASLVLLPFSSTTFGAPIALLIAAFFAGFAWLDYPASRYELDFGEKLRLALRHWALLIGFGLGFLSGMLIPFFNPCLVAPAGAAGSAELWLRLDKRGTRRAAAGASSDG